MIMLKEEISSESILHLGSFSHKEKSVSSDSDEALEKGNRSPLFELVPRKDFPRSQNISLESGDNKCSDDEDNMGPDSIASGHIPSAPIRATAEFSGIMGEPQLGSGLGEDEVDSQNKEEKGQGENGPNQRIGTASVLGCRIKSRRECLKNPAGQSANRLLAEIAASALICLKILTGHLSSSSWFPPPNYVVQFILELKIDYVTRVVMSQLKGCFVRFSINKYASNVGQKCLNAFDDGQVNLIVSEVVTTLIFEQFIKILSVIMLPSLH
ncbi:hypothetical protein Ancab_017001 [Ancistrocladus abbreviatus]